MRDDLEQAVEIVRRAGRLTLDWFQARDLQVDRKGDGSPVTEADRAAEQYIREQLATRFPEDAVVGEEQADTGGTSGRRWVIDPIDGTRSFTKGVPLYTTLLALIDEDGPAVGVVYVPALDEMVAAARGLGCFHDDAPCRVSAVAALDEAYVTASGFETAWWPEEPLVAICNSGMAVRTWGDGYGYVLTATGRVEAMVDLGLNLWDVAPMLVVIPEAGGRITSWEGAPMPMGGAVLATNGVVHDEVLALLRT